MTMHPDTLPDDKETVILVDENDEAIGTAGKLEVHLDARLHRAVSVFAVTSAGELIIQKRAAAKYHSAGKWANTACGHPRPGEPLEAAARRRMRAELGFEAPLTHGFSTLYKADCGNGLTEHELVHVFFCKTDEAPSPVPSEVERVRSVSLAQVRQELASSRDEFAVWFQFYLDEHFDDLQREIAKL
ncbi:isopentenyl-diphosphate Delta-isomerase [Pseudovibrio exalbescens]|uniref:isopentenyl-diphosphate Delta-isomerase n=1 Tax=Pseudovibrio exalbescens TaxID=197461 RepID=UPI002366201A|nr:isopentenyl-diphosphate Delta-isomerase [Pseudovibrio exalbescens]MDD7911016.1 isopentenyl-diphosphate Delta-isomerase [Pseudovibrio exalbescens]